MATLQIDKQDVIEWTVRSNYTDGTTASITVADQEDKYVEADIIRKQYELHYSPDSGTTFIKMFTGHVAKVTPTVNVSSETSEIVLSSFFSTLENKPVHTENLAGSTYKAILGTVLEDYGSVPTAFTDFTGITDAATISASILNFIVNERSILTAIRLLADAVISKISINRNGNIVGKDVAESIDAVTWDLDEARLLNTQLDKSDADGISAVRVRGRFITLAEIVGAKTTIFGPEDVTFRLFGEQNFIIIKLYLDIGTRDAWFDFEITENSAGVSAEIIGVFSNSILVSFTKDSGNWGQGETVTVTDVTIKAFLRPEWEVSSRSNESNPMPKGQPLNLFSTYRVLVRPFVSFDLQKTTRGERDATEQDDSRIEYSLIDTDLKNKFGIRWEEIDNPYIDTLTRAQEVAERFITQLKQATRLWRVTMTPQTSGTDMPDLGDVVSFIPVRRSGGANEITGVVVETIFTYSPGLAEAIQTLIVEEFISASFPEQVNTNWEDVNTNWEDMTSWSI